MREQTRRLPDFLIIGAMKAGTTTLYRDLLTNPEVFMPFNKEPCNLCSDDVLTDQGQTEYARHFKNASTHQICGEASTNYSKLPDHPSVAQRARRLCGEGLRVIYIIREPVARIVSHHHHALTTGRCGLSIDEEVRRQPMLLDYTRYAMQAQPWIESLGRERVMIIRFEDFVADRRGTVGEVSRFLGIRPRTERIDERAVFNRSKGKPLAPSIWNRIRGSRTYQRFVQPCLPLGVRDRLQRALLPGAPPRPAPPSEKTIAFIRGELATDMERLRILLNLDGPVWPSIAVESGK